MEQERLMMVILDSENRPPAHMTSERPRDVDSDDESKQREDSAMLPPASRCPHTRVDIRMSGSDVEGNQIDDVNEDSNTITDDVKTTHTNVTTPPSHNASRTSITSILVDVCRICHCESEPGSPLISPCLCSGSLKYVHQACLQQWIKSADTKSCELCKFEFEMTTKIKPFRKWTRLDMTSVERRKIMCSVTFHVIAITCVIWSLYVLIDRTTEELRSGELEWPFWTKLIVVAIGFVCGLVFMYVQCKLYVQLCRRWRAYNRVIHIQNAPEKKVRPPDLPLQVKSIKTDV